MPEATCAYCHRHPADEDWQPFCGERCKFADLGHWLSGDYRVKGDPFETDPGDSPDDDQ